MSDEEMLAKFEQALSGSASGRSLTKRHGLAAMRAVAEAAWDEALEVAGDQWAEGDGSPIVNPYREGTP